MRHDAALTATVHERACDHLLAGIRAGQLQEDLCFALWRPATGAQRRTALVFDVITPVAGDRHLHGNVSFDPRYLTRAVRLACSQNAGLAFMHNHLSGGWQDMSNLDVVAERDRISPPTRATSLPLLGLTLGTDGSWSGRFWEWNGRRFNRSWCDKVRVVGRRLRVTFNDQQVPPAARQAVLLRTVDTWGEARQRDIARLRVGIVGLGSVGCIVAEALARMGIENIVLIDPDKVEIHNLDRLLYAAREDVGTLKVELVAKHLHRSATAVNFRVKTYARPIQDANAYLAALDCDALVSAVDRPLPKDLLNRIAYTHCIPVVSGGVYIDNKPDGTLGQAAWSVAVVGPGRRCLRCDGQYTTSDVTMERDGSLDDPAYMRRAVASEDMTPVNQNVFPFSANVASFMVIELVRSVVADAWWPDTGGKLHYSMIPSQLRHAKAECGANCSVNDSTALGDQYRYPFLQAVGVEPQRPSWLEGLRKRARHWTPGWWTRGQ